MAELIGEPCQACLNATLACKKCRELQLNEAMVTHYCSKACQKACWPRNKRFHAAFEPQSDYGIHKSIHQTTALAMLELKARGKLPVIASGGAVCILFAGASTRYEIDLDGLQLLQALKDFCYPDMGALHVTMCGPEIQTDGIRNVGPDVTITSIISTVQAAFSSPAALASSFQLCMIIAPGYTDFLDKWDPAMTMLVASGVPLCVTSYSSANALDNDALFDQDCVETFWRASVVVGTQINQCCVPLPNGALGHKSRYYTIVQGINKNAPVVEKKAFKRGMTARYMRFQADYYRARDAYFAVRCEAIAASLEDGTLPYAEESMGSFVRMAQHG